MTLTIKNKEQLREINNFNIFFGEDSKQFPLQNGVSIKMPEFDEIKRTATSQIFNAGFNLVQPTSLDQANCIIRCFKLRHYILPNQEVCNIYGFQLYTQKRIKWKTMAYYGKKLEYLPDYWLSLDLDFGNNVTTTVNVQCDVSDYYIRIS